MLTNMPQMHLKLLQKERFKRQQKQLVVSLEIKFVIKLQVSKSSPKDNSNKEKTNEGEILRQRYIHLQSLDIKSLMI